MGKSSINGSFSMAMLNNQMVYHVSSSAVEKKGNKPLDSSTNGKRTSMVVLQFVP